MESACYKKDQRKDTRVINKCFNEGICCLKQYVYLLLKKNFTDELVTFEIRNFCKMSKIFKMIWNNSRC